MTVSSASRPSLVSHVADVNNTNMAATEDQLARLSKVKDIITKASQELKSIEVNREIDLEFDVGNLLVTDKNTLDEEAV